jgi:F-type H+-transporting ATPase subunit b
MNLLTLAAAAVKDPPILDLDSTVFLQLGVFVVTAILLSRLLFRPYLEVRAQRGAGMEGARDDARRMDEEAAARLADYEHKLAQARARANAERAKLQGEAVARDHEITDAARASVQSAIEKARAELDAGATRARAQLEPRAQEIARAIFKKILGREAA